MARITLRVELGFIGDTPSEDQWAAMQAKGIAWLQHAQADVESQGEPFLTRDAAGRTMLAFDFTCEEGDFFVGGRLMLAVKRAFPEAGVNQAAIVSVVG